MKINFPFKAQDLKQWRNAAEHYQADLSSEGGWFPVGKNLFWHGGCHIDGNQPVHVVMDGRLVAYRITKQFIDPKSDDKMTYEVKIQRNGETRKEKETALRYPFSNNFVLTEHTFSPPQNKPFTFFMLAMNLCPLEELTDEQKKTAPLFFKHRFFVNYRLPSPAGDGLNLMNLSGGNEVLLTTIPHGSYVIELEEYSKLKHAIGKVKVAYSYFDESGMCKTMEGYVEKSVESWKEECARLLRSDRSKSNLSRLQNTGSEVKYKIITTKDKNTRLQGLSVHEYPFAASQVLAVIPKGAELFFEDPGNIADLDGNLLPNDTSFGKIIKYRFEEKDYHIEGFVKIDSETIEVKRRIPLHFDQVQQPEQIEIKANEVLGWSGKDGNMANDGRTVHIEIFMIDEDNFDNFKSYTNNNPNHNHETKDQSLELSRLIEKDTIQQSLVKLNGAKEVGLCDASVLIDKVHVDHRGSVGQIGIDEMHQQKSQIAYNLVTRMVAKHKSEWKYSDTDFKRLKGKECFDAFNYVFSEKFSFWDKLKDSNGKTFPDEAYFFHPIRFIEHLKLLQNFIKLKYVNEKEKSAKVETTYLVYDEDGNLIHRGRFKDGYAYFKKSELTPDKKYYVWLDERMGNETLEYRGKLYRKYEAKRFHFNEQLYQYLDIRDWEARWRKDRALEVNSRLGPAGSKNLQRHGPTTNWINRGDILFIPLEEIKVNKTNVFEVEEEWETWESEETLVQISSHLASTIGPEGGEIKGMAASMTSKVVFSNRKLRKAYELQYHVKVESVHEGLDINLISGAISEAFGSRKFRKGTSPREVFDSYEGKSFVKEFILPTPVVSISVGSFKGEKGPDGHFWDGSFISGSIGASVGLYMELVLYYWNPAKKDYEGYENYPDPKDVSDYVFRFDNY